MQAEVFRHTPAWVWVLLLFLIYRGIAALWPRRTSVKQTLLLPVIFLLLGLSSIHTALNGELYAYLAFCGFLVAGVIAGWLIVPPRLVATYDRSSRKVLRPGSALTLILLVLAFASKFILSAVVARNPAFAADASFVLTFGGVSGFVSGLFWGVVLRQLWPVRNDILSGRD
ncbi:hypothetical protein CEG14_17560 [Bordetella genomosp. 1]|uniref:DUF1453 domain-containing protein n=1 Tax=Bordetella genomosp. 1 TaxID=1395607 RepID=A0A261S8F9_9BORD|nr:DUF6622 family protein [Bordetella genomosp. 1]OZI32713.1 hypothetical protein CEG14_17560 [Bordetella genomosp. 1]